MKKILLINLLFFNPLLGQITQGYEIKVETIVAGQKEMEVQYNFHAEDQDYVAGGITFSYPTDFFSEPPTVSFALQLNGQSYLPSLSFSVTITSNSATSTGVRVNKTILGLPIAEAATNDVTVHIRATAPAGDT